MSEPGGERESGRDHAQPGDARDGAHRTRIAVKPSSRSGVSIQLLLGVGQIFVELVSHRRQRPHIVTVEDAVEDDPLVFQQLVISRLESIKLPILFRKPAGTEKTLVLGLGDP